MKITSTTKSEEVKENMLKTLKMLSEKEPMGITTYSKGIYPSTNIPFEDRYKKLLEGINEEELIPLPENNVVESIDEINCAENGFIARYCLGNVVGIDEPPQPAKSKVFKNK